MIRVLYPKLPTVYDGGRTAYVQKGRHTGT